MSEQIKSGIYAITNIQTGDRYIGSSVNVPKRLSQHISMLRIGKHHSSVLQAAWDEHGEDAFSTDILVIEPDITKLVGLEQKFFNTEKPKYNVAKVALSPGLIYRLDPKLMAEMREKRRRHNEDRRGMLAEAIRYFAPKKEEEDYELLLDQMFDRYGAEKMEQSLRRLEAKDTFILMAKEWYERGVHYDRQWKLYHQLHDITFGLTIADHKRIKGDVEDLILAMSTMELAYFSRSISIVIAVHEERDSHGFNEIERDIREVSTLGQESRIQTEKMIGRPIVTARNMLKEPDGGLFGDTAQLFQIEPPKEGC